MSIQEIITNGGGVLVIVMTLVQIAPIKISPWSWLAKAIGKAMGLDRIEKKLDAHIEMDDRRTADGHRARILHFNNELRRIREVLRRTPGISEQPGRPRH